MNNKNKKVMIIVGVIILALAIFMIYKGSSKKQNGDNSNNPNKTSEINKTNEIVKTLEDGQKVNKSEKMKETKKIGNIEISNIILNFQNNESQLTAKVKNVGNTAEGDYFIKITMLDKNGAAIGEVKGYVDKIEAGKEKNISIKVSADLVDAYDVKIERI